MHSLEDEWEDQNRERLMNTVLLANQLVREANMLSEALHKDTIFRVTLTVSIYVCMYIYMYMYMYTVLYVLNNNSRKVINNSFIYVNSNVTFNVHVCTCIHVHVHVYMYAYYLLYSILQIPKSFLSPRQRMSSEEMHTSNEIAIRVIHRQRGTDSVWSLNTLAEKVLTMRDMYQRIEEGGSGSLLVSLLIMHMHMYMTTCTCACALMYAFMFMIR